MKKVLFLIYFSILFGSFLKADLIMGVVPQQGPLKLFNIWQPVANYLSKETGIKIRFRTEKSIQKFSETLYKGKYDFVYMSPLNFVLVNTKVKYDALARSDKLIRGVLVMKKDATIKDLKKNDARILFPSPAAFAATILIKYDLIEKFGFTDKQLENARYVNSHDSVYKGLFRGLGDLGGGIERTFNYTDNRPLHQKLHIIHKTKGYPTHPFAARATLSDDIKKKLTKALLKMPKNLLDRLHMKKLKKVDSGEYDSVKRLAHKLNIKVD